MSVHTRIRALAAIFAVTTGALVMSAAPAHAAPSGRSGDACWLDSSTAVTRCFADEAALEAAVAESGRILIEEDSLSARLPAGVLASFVLVRFYDGGSYTGATFVITNASSTACSGPAITGNLPAFNDKVSSFHSYFGCSTRIFENNGSGGAWFGYVTDATGVGVLDNLASSYSID